MVSFSAGRHASLQLARKFFIDVMQEERRGVLALEGAAIVGQLTATVKYTSATLDAETNMLPRW
jgi:hypothetical protein